MNARLSLVALALLAIACGSRAETPSGVATASSSAATASATSTPAPTPSPSATLRPNPTAGPGTYTSLAYGYRVDLPTGWRRSACQSTRDPSQPPGVETFTNASVDDESGTDTGAAQDIVTLRIEDNAGGQTALGWLESGKMGFWSGFKFEQVSFDNNPDAARFVTQDGATVRAYVVNARFRIYAIAQGLREPTPASVAATLAIMRSLHILRDAELADARSTLAAPPVPAARSAEEVADTLSRGFALKDTSILATVADTCLSTALENAGVGFSSTAKALAGMQKSFATGLVVAIQPRPLEFASGSSSQGAMVRGTWTDPGQPQRNVKLMMTKVRDTWYWIGVLYLRP